MARQVLPWVGAAVGMWAGGNWQLGFAIGSALGNAVDPQVIKGPQLGEGTNSTASEGGYRPIVFGKGRVGTCIIHQGPLIKRTIRTRQSKGGGPVTEEQRAYRTLAFALGESAYPDTGVQLLRLWIDNKLRYDVTPTSQIVSESAEFANEFTFYPGDETQEPDPDLEAMPVENGGGAGNVPSYRGGCPYIVFPEWDVTDSGGRAPMVLAELATISTTQASTAVLAASWPTPNNEGRIWRSNDGDVFEGGIDTGIDAEISSIFGAGGRAFVFSGTTAGRSSADGVNWETITGLDSGGTEVRGLAYADGVWCLCYQNSSVISRSTDGINFASVATTFRSRYAMAAHEDTFIAASTNGAVTCSFDKGLTFTDVGLLGSTNSFESIVRTDSLFVAFLGGTAGDLFYSATGLPGSWESMDAPLSFTGNTPVLGVMPGLVVVGDNTESAYSTNGGTVWMPGGVPGGTSNVQSTMPGNSVGIYKGAASIGSMVSRTNNGADWIGSTTQNHEVIVAAVDFSGQVVTSDKIPLSTIATWIHDRVDIPPSKYNVSALTDLVEGVVFADGYTGASAMQAFMPLYHFDAGEFDAGSGYRINYVKRGAPAAVTLTEADIVEGPEDWEREDSYERPRVLHLAYQNPVADYGAPNIVIKRTSPDVLVVGERSASVPVVFSDVDEITRRADIMMTIIYTEIAGTYELILPWSLLDLAPTDVIGFSIRGRVRRLRLDQWRFSPDGTIKCELWADRQSAYTSNVTGLPAVPSTPPPPSIVGPTISAVLDIPGLTDELDTLHLIVAASGQTPAWYGANHQRKLPSDPDYSSGPTFSGVTTIMGLLQDDVAAASEHFTDTTNVVRVSLFGPEDELQTYTQQQFLSENGAFALAYEDSGERRWEVLQYRDAVKVGDNVWELTTLLRGRLDTDAAAHPIGSMFVLLDAGIRAMAMTSSMIGQDVTHRAVSFGQLPDQAVPYTEEYTGQSQREWPVANVFAELDGDDLDVSYIPRHRFGTDDNPVRSVNWIGYRVSATDGVNSAAVDTTADSHTFDATGWSTPITVSVSQLNRITGAGPAVTEEVE